MSKVNGNGMLPTEDVRMELSILGSWGILESSGIRTAVQKTFAVQKKLLVLNKVKGLMINRVPKGAFGWLAISLLHCLITFYNEDSFLQYA